MTSIAGNVRILLVDDHALVRRGLKEILSEELNIVEFGEAVDGREAIAKVTDEKWDAVVLDITIPGRDGLAVLKEIKKLHPSLPVLVLSVHPADRYAPRVMRAGASGYMTKESAAEELIGAMRIIMEGRRYLGPDVAARLIADLNHDHDKAKHEQLSDREYQVMVMLAEGLRVSEIALDLDLSAKTISTYRGRVLQKLSLSNNAELARYAIDHNLMN